MGNVRVSFARNSAGAPEITGTNNYYPFGLNHIGGGKSPFSSYHAYKFGGKELQKTGMYDFGARMYMPDLGRWGVIDPLAETMRRYSPYNYAFNNPISFIDPDGMAPLNQFRMMSDSRPDATSGWTNPNWLGRGSYGNIDYGETLAPGGGGSVYESEYGTVYEGSYARDAFSDLVSGNPPRSKNNGSIWNKIGGFFRGLFGSEKRAKVEAGPAVEITESQFKIGDITGLLLQTFLFGNTDPYSAIGNMGVGPYAEERENVGIVGMLFINPEAAAEGLERKALSRAAMSKIWGASSLRIDPENLPKTVTNDFINILAGRGNPIMRNGVQETVRHNVKWAGALEWKIKDIPGSTLNGSRIIQHPDGRLGGGVDHDYTKIIQIPTSSAVKWK
ncbi:RHS repeat domain-containing protein [Chryseobacterium indologenes]|uniref:RHS repeat domain-containing protein n=3 Tax=Chryseobacterium indologenes TaxID=253 RepID=UPI002938F7E1|nr:RHS repeat-associated core domain-containing protein [Chryseobacterium indologenes]